MLPAFFKNLSKLRKGHIKVNVEHVRDFDVEARARRWTKRSHTEVIEKMCMQRSQFFKHKIPDYVPFLQVKMAIVQV